MSKPGSTAASSSPLFHRPGLIYFWALNGSMDYRELQEQLNAFAKARVSAIVLHPRAGLTLPYGGDDWFDRIVWICDRCEELDLDVWLYDEDPFPSGAAGGRLVAEHPELAGYRIERFVAGDDLQAGDNFCFPAGRLLWCGWVGGGNDARPLVDLTSRVGMIRRRWVVLDPWDSRYYYPDTPQYSCPRAMACGEEFALRISERHEGQRLMAFIARPAAADESERTWTTLPDWLNPAAAAKFLEITHEQYRRRLGERFGRRIRAIFTDEPKFQDTFPFTPGIFEDFHAQFGYDLRPRLGMLFEDPASDDETAAVRLNYRQWCADRFERAWLEPVAQWCQKHGLCLVGHISPEDDPIQQAGCVGNLLPLMRHFAIPGIDLIIPAVGDRRHLMLNNGILSATSVSQQNKQAGVLSESLACSGRAEQASLEQMRRVLLWQAMMGVTTHVIHAAYLSMKDNRAIDAPPDLGPNSGYWPDLGRIADEIKPIQAVVAGARQIAPVAIVWPIRTFQMLKLDWENDSSGLRRAFNEFVGDCLDRQVGIHFLDESSLWQSIVEKDELRLGKACYTHVLVVSAHVLHERTLATLKAFEQSGGTTAFVDHLPKWVQSEKGVVASFPADGGGFVPTPAARVLAQLPRLLAGDNVVEDLRCTMWQAEGRTTTLLMNLAHQPRSMSIEGRVHTLVPGEVVILPAE